MGLSLLNKGHYKCDFSECGALRSCSSAFLYVAYAAQKFVAAADRSPPEVCGRVSTETYYGAKETYYHWHTRLFFAARGVSASSNRSLLIHNRSLSRSLLAYPSLLLLPGESASESRAPAPQ